MIESQAEPASLDVRAVLAADPEMPRPLVLGLVQEAPEAEMTAMIGAAEG